MNNDKSVKKKLLVLVVVLLIIFGGIVFYYEKLNSQEQINSKNNIFTNTIEKTYSLLLKNLDDEVAKRVDIILSSGSVREKFAKKDREGLYKELAKRYTYLVKTNKYLKIMTFRLADGSTFLRVHKPKMYGDKLNKKRKIIIDTNHLKKRQYGFEVGKLKMTYRVVTPIFYKGEHIGLVEIGVEPEYITNKMYQIFGFKNALLIKKSDASVSIDKVKLNQVGKDFALARGDQLFKNHIDEIKFNIKHNHILENNRTYHIHSDLNLYNHKDQVAAKILLAYDVTDDMNNAQRLLTINMLRIVVLLILLMIVLNFGFNYFINNMIKEVNKNRDKDKKLQEQMKMVQMGEMIGNIAHQWRQPLNAISTATSGLIVEKELGIDTKESDKAILESVVHKAHYLSETIDTFRDFIKEKKEYKEVILQDRISVALKIVGTTLKDKHIKLIDEVDYSSPIKIRLIVGELSQVIINILNNSKDVLIEREIKNSWVKLNSYVENENVVITIEDNAGGIAEDIMPKIFDPYFTTKHKSQGTGLGLNMSYKIITQSLKGNLYVKNSENGAKFFIVLPLT